MRRQPLALIGEPRIELYEGDIDADMARIGTIKATDEIIGGLSKPSKMPEYAYSLPATSCNVGSRPQEIRGSVCQRCYTLSRQVGYASPSQFSRDYRRFFGRAPAQDVDRLREAE